MITLGSRITHSHLAGIVRRNKKAQIKGYEEWFFPTKGNGVRPAKSVPFTVLGLVPGRPPEEHWNKSVAFWEQPGVGVVIGLERKLLGRSVEGGGYTNVYGEGEYEQGWFEANGHVDLYLVRWELRDRAYGYVLAQHAAPSS